MNVIDLPGCNGRSFQNSPRQSSHRGNFASRPPIPGLRLLGCHLVCSSIGFLLGWVADRRYCVGAPGFGRRDVVRRL